jgi:glycosyltransferase involved in cell wall biosynthesis
VTRAVHQLIPNLAFGDAISQQALALRKMLRGLGHESEIYAENVDVRLRGEARPYRRLREEAGSAVPVLFHFSLASEVTDMFRLLENPRVLVYHNITPPEFFRGVNERVARSCAEGREELAGLARHCRIAVGVSEFNRAELEALGFPRTAVLPNVLDPDRYALPSEPKLLGYRDGHVNFLHVGRLAPNKKIEDLIKVFHFYRRKINPDSRLLLVGIDTDMEVYALALRQLIHDLGVRAVGFAGRATERELLTYYRVADVYLCMSEHEGFCVPILEAMHLGVPVIAYASSAIPETLGEAGALVLEKNFAEIAELAALLCEDSSLRAALVEAGRRRAREFFPQAVLPRLREIVESL